jgi:hypothetical protein
LEVLEWDESEGVSFDTNESDVVPVSNVLSVRAEIEDGYMRPNSRHLITRIDVPYRDGRIIAVSQAFRNVNANAIVRFPYQKIILVPLDRRWFPYV